MIKIKPKIFFSDKVSGGSGKIGGGGKGDNNQNDSKGGVESELQDLKQKVGFQPRSERELQSDPELQNIRGQLDSGFDNRLTPKELDEYGESERVKALNELEENTPYNLKPGYDKGLGNQEETDRQNAFQDPGGNKKVGEEDDRLNENYKQQLAGLETDAPMEPSAVGESSPLRYAQAKNGQRLILPGQSDGTGRAVNPLQMSDQDEQVISQGVVDRINNGKGRLNLANKAREMFGQNGDQKDRAIAEHEGEKALQAAETAKDFARQVAIKKAKDFVLKQALAAVASIMPWLLLIALFFSLIVVASAAVICLLDRNPVTQVFLPANLKGFCGGDKGGGACPAGYVAWQRDGSGQWVEVSGATTASGGTPGGGSYSGGSFCFDKGVEGKTSFSLWRANNGLKQETYSVEKVKEVIEAGKQAGVSDYAIAWAIALAPTESGFDWTVWNGSKYDCWGLIQFCRSGLGGRTYQRISQKVAGRDVPPSEFIKDKPLQMKFVQAEFDDKKAQNCRYAQGKGDFYLVSYAHLGCVRPGGGDGNTKSADYGEAAIRNAAFFECDKLGQPQSTASNSNDVQPLVATVTKNISNFGKIFTGIPAQAQDAESDQTIRDRVAGYFEKGEFHQTGSGPNDRTSVTRKVVDGIKNNNFNINTVKYLDNLYKAGFAVATGPFDWGRSYGKHGEGLALDIWGLGYLKDLNGTPIKGLKTSGISSGLAGGAPDAAVNNGNTVDPRIRRHVDIPADSVAREMFAKAIDIYFSSNVTYSGITHPQFSEVLGKGYKSTAGVALFANNDHKHHFHAGFLPSSQKPYQYSEGGAGGSSGISGATGGSGAIVCCPTGVSPDTVSTEPSQSSSESSSSSSSTTAFGDVFSPVQTANQEKAFLDFITSGFSLQVSAEVPMNKPSGSDPATQFMVRVATMEGAFATGSGGPNIPQKNNNPGNLKGPSSLIENYLKQKFPGSYASGIPTDSKKHLIFQTQEHGWAALYYFFQRNFAGNVAPYDKAKTIGEFFNIYAPSSDGNNLSSYMKFIEEGNIALPSGGKITRDTPISEMAKLFGSDYQGGLGGVGNSGACCLPSGDALGGGGTTATDNTQPGTSADVETLKAKIKSGEIKIWKRNSSRGFVSEDFFIQDIDKQKADPNVAKFILTMHSKYPNSVVNALGDLSHGYTGGNHNTTPLLAVDIGGINTANVDNESKAVIDKYLADAQATGLVTAVGLSPVVRAKGVSTANQFADSVGHIHFTIKKSTTTGYLDQQKDSESDQNINNLANNSVDFDFAKIFTGVEAEAAESQESGLDIEAIWNGIINGVPVEAAGDKYQQALGSDYSLDKYYDANNKAFAARSGSLDKRFPGSPNYFIMHITSAANVYDGGNDTKVLGQQFHEGITRAGPNSSSGFTPFGMTLSGKVTAFYDPLKYWGEATDGNASRGNARIREITTEGKAGKVLYSGSGATSVDAVAVQVEMIANSGASATDAQAVATGKLIAASGVMPDKVLTHYAVQPSDRKTDDPFIAKDGSVDARLVKLVNTVRQSNSAWKSGQYTNMTDEQVAAMITKVNLLMAQANGDASITDAIIAKLGADKIVVSEGNSGAGANAVSGAGCTGVTGGSTAGDGGSTNGTVGTGSAALLALARSASEGKRPDGRCQFHVESYLDRVTLGGLSTKGLNFPNPVGFQPYLVANKDKLGIKNLLDENPNLNPYNAPPGSVVIVTPGGIGTCAAVHGDIAVADGNGKFYNGGVNSFGGEKCWNGTTSVCKNSPRCGSYGQTGKLLGIWVPK